LANKILMNWTKEEGFDKDWSHTYFDSQTLYYDDIKYSLMNNAWLNDSIITFYFL
jgi:hypothetical protein